MDHKPATHAKTVVIKSAIFYTEDTLPGKVEEKGEENSQQEPESRCVMDIEEGPRMWVLL